MDFSIVGSTSEAGRFRERREDDFLFDFKPGLSSIKHCVI
jgi:hypothetical protein